ncbi:putative GIY-YIG superfamily endonuclease [Lipingzhangella halophila]|uniref:Putative GIY-YIG superfamily endonuclease n=1 Tax=Lipingzhangella halophila TaxID=1783352 RepID=A0A7W7W2D1_9ACTN|nr:hypothetical protein [Lipingzhangella halophila]MBB4931872.1 putative GIY-YIG superfamily endonuclease [Lipingzhangella halophila]
MDNPSAGSPVFNHEATPTPAPTDVIFLDRWLAFIRGAENLPDALRFVCESMASDADENGQDCAPGHKRLIADTGLSSALVSDSLKVLRKLGVIELVSDSHPPAKGPHQYRLTAPDGFESLADERVRQGFHKEEFTLPGSRSVSFPAPDDNLFPAPKPLSETPTPKPVSAKPAPRQQSKRRKEVALPRTSRGETLLYRYYDEHDVLLYVGVSANLMARQTNHEADSTWMDFAARSTIERFTARADAESAERTAIEEHQPLFNIEHNEHPDRIRRLVDYLIERDRRDLLVPLISRG